MLSGISLDQPVTLWDWRRRMSDAYAAVRAAVDPAEAWLVWRATRDALFRDHAQSPLDPDDRAAFPGLPFFPYDNALRFTVPLAPAAGPLRVVSAGADGDVRLRPFARTSGLAPLLGADLTLFWIEGYGGGVFLPFSDATNGSSSYGGGRYLLDTIKGADLGNADGGVILDFNFAYHPSCRYSARYICPLSPPENRLPAAMRAGERLGP